MDPIDQVASDEEPAPRRRGRPRDPGADRRILRAARAVAADAGIRGSSMSAIADRSGVGKPTICLRWANRQEVMLAALADLRGPLNAEHTGDTRDDLLRVLREDRDTLVAGPEARFLRSVLFEAETDAALAQELEATVLGPRRERLAEVLRRGVRDGGVRGDVEPGRLADLLSGLLLRAMVVGGAGAVDDDALAAWVGVFLDGIGATPGTTEAARR